MKLKKWALVAEIIGGVAIVASLMFVGIEINRNSQISEVNAYQDLIAQISLINTLRIENPEFAGLYSRFDNGEQPQNEIEYAQIEAFLFMVFRHGDLAFRQYENGLISETSLISVLAPVRAFLNTEMGQLIWSSLEPNLNPGYVDYIDRVGLLCEVYTGKGSACETV